MARAMSAAAAINGLLSFVVAVHAMAQQVGYNNNLVVPLVAQTSSYATQIFVHNPSSGPIDVTFSYAGASSSATAGSVSCNTLSIAASEVVETSLGELCPLLNPGSNFGALASSSIYSFAIYARVQTPSGNGFSVDGMLDNVCCGGIREVTGLIRQAALPTYQSNCFLLNQEMRAGRLVVTLVTGDGRPLAAQIVDIQPGEVVRMLDIFAALSAPAGDYANVRASFESIVPIEGGTPVNFAAACTVQNNTSFDADFRIAKNHF